MAGSIKSASKGNLHICASTDILTTEQDYQTLHKAGWSTMFFGNDNQAVPCQGAEFVDCPKTAKSETCDTCGKGCFETKQTHVKLLEHGTASKIKNSKMAKYVISILNQI